MKRQEGEGTGPTPGRDLAGAPASAEPDSAAPGPAGPDSAAPDPAAPDPGAPDAGVLAPGVLDPDAPGSGADVPILLQVRPRKISIYAAIAASTVVAAMVVIGLLLLNSNEGVAFRTSDQIGLIGVGLILGGLIMTAARPRLRADRNGVWVRNMLGDEFVPWPLVLRIAYPQGAPWAQLNMPDDEDKPVMAIQALDRGRAVQALEAVRALQAKYGPPPPAPAPRVTPPGMSAVDDDQSRDVRLGDSQNVRRPLGRLEIIDREKAAERDREARAKQEKLARKAARRGSAG